METTDFLTLGAYAAIWGFASPVLISFVKNIGKTWPLWLKKWTAIAFAGIGTALAYGLSVGIGDVSFNDWEGFWVPLIAGLGVIYPMAQVSYANFWKGNTVEVAAANALTGSG